MCIWKVSLSQLIINEKEKTGNIVIMELLKIRKNYQESKEIKMKNLSRII